MSEPTDNNEVIAEAELRAYESWQMPVLGAAGNVVSTSGKTTRRTGGRSGPEPLTASKIEAIREQAYQEGLNLGKQEGLRQAQAEIDDKSAQLDRVMGQLMHPLAEQGADLEQALIHLVKTVAQSVVQTSVELDEERLLKVIKQAIEQLPDASQNIRVIVHPRDAELIKRVASPQAEEWKIIPDASLVSGGCIVKTDYSYVDFTLEKQFQLNVDEMTKRHMAQQTDGAQSPDSPDELE